MGRNQRSGRADGHEVGFDAAYYERHVPHLRRRVARMGFVGADMDDLVQSTFLVARDGWKNRPRDGRGHRKWLDGIAWRLGMNLLRSREMHHEQLDTAWLDEFAMEVEDIDARIDAQRLLWVASDVLLLNDGDMLVAHYVDDVPVTEIAARCGLAPSTVWARIQRIRRDAQQLTLRWQL